MSGPSYRITKRILDVLFGIVGCVFFGVLYVVIGPIIKLNSLGPVIVGLPRVSRGRVITLYKFRSMVKDAHLQKDGLRGLNERTDGPFFKIRRDPRVTAVGRIIRSMRLDEVPQFFNVVKGDLSLVGPRPHEQEEVAHYPAEFKFLPGERAGITGLSQVSGASSLPFRKELELDSYYIRHQSLWLDLKIIAKTVVVFFFDPTAV
jgi:lipopolysaccharide/colanic/teichoic acid biosynthesis glycosyltransferase